MAPARAQLTAQRAHRLRRRLIGAWTAAVAVLLAWWVCCSLVNKSPVTSMEEAITALEWMAPPLALTLKVLTAVVGVSITWTLWSASLGLFGRWPAIIIVSVLLVAQRHFPVLMPLLSAFLLWSLLGAERKAPPALP